MVGNEDPGTPPSRRLPLRGPGDEEPRARMTLRVSRDSGRTWEREAVVREGDPVVILYNPGRYPPCECALCADQRPVSARSLRPGAVHPGAA